MLFILIRRLNLILILLCILYFSVLNTKHQINRWFSGLPLLSAPESFSRGMPVRGSITIYSCSNKSQSESLESVIKSSETLADMEQCHVQSRKHLSFCKGHSNQTVRPQSLLSVFTSPLGFIFNSGTPQSFSHFNFTPPEILKNYALQALTWFLLSLLTYLTGVRALWWWKANQMSAPRWLMVSQTFTSCLFKINTVCSRMWKSFWQIYADIQVNPKGSNNFFLQLNLRYRSGKMLGNFTEFIWYV